MMLLVETTKTPILKFKKQLKLCRFLKFLLQTVKLELLEIKRNENLMPFLRINIKV